MAAPSAHGRPPLLFALAFIALAVVVTLLDHFGLPARAIDTTLGVAVLVGIAAIGINSSTLQASEFYLAGRSIPAALNGFASAAGAMSGLVFLGLAGAYFTDAGAAAALPIGWALGFLILAVAVAPYVRKSAAFGIVDFLGIRYGGRAVRIAAVGVVVVGLLAGLIAALGMASMLTATLLDIPGSTAITIVAAVVLASSVLGGFRAVTRTAIAEYAVLAIGFLVPVVVVSMREYTLPIPPLTFGNAAKEAALLVLASGKDLAAPLTGQLSSAAGGVGVVASVVVLAAGVAALPLLTQRAAAVRGPDRARRSMAWGMLAVLIIALAAPAYAAFGRLIILREVVDSPIENLPDWIFSFGHLGLVRICRIDATSVDAVLGACSALAGFTGNLNAGDLAISGDAIVLAGPAIFDLPYAVTALVTVGALAAALGAAKATTFALAAALGHDLYAGVIDPRASAGRQLIVTRLAALVAVLLGAWIAGAAGGGAFGLAPVAISLSAGGLFPALILAIWWKRANACGAVAGIVAGGVVTAVLIAEHQFPGFMPFGRLGFNNLTAAIVGMPVSFVAAVAAALATDPPPEDRLVTIDAIRRPGGTPFVQETESL